ncbi:fungal-specific transcription factor domain-containing protein [Coniochaeta sp. 2T2.1]|nr:fungal-specific transcription factor domain-containing protein [Coniochaeta sp. 2T2.1]
MDTGSDPAAAGPPQSSDTGSSSRLPAATQQHHHQQQQQQQQNHNQISDQFVMKLTRGHSCVLCQQRKVRCDKQKPCANCVKANVECRVVPPQPPRRRRKKPHERDLVDRLKKYEALLAQHGVSFEPIADDFKASDNADDIADLGQDLSGLKTSPESSVPDYTQGDGEEKDIKYFPYFNGYRQTQVLDSSDEEYEGPTIHHAFDAMFENGDAFPFAVGGTQASVTNSHPAAIQIFQLWQIYINNVNPLLKISHVPTLQGQIIAASANPAKISKSLEALMFAIYFIAITSMKEEEVQNTFGEDRNILIGKYHTATQQALVNAGFMRSTELMVLQAYVLYLGSVRQYTDPRTLFCLIGIAVRMATRFGLHRDGAQFGITPFDTEMRRRLWWQIVMFDKRIAEITGSSITALSSSGGDCRLPLNINDTDLNTHAKDPPNPYQGPTEMLFCLTRIEMTVAAAPNGARANLNTPMGNKPRVHYSPSPSSPDLVTHVANVNLPQDLDGYCNYIENVYLKHADPKIPLHFFTLMMTRQALCKLRVIDFMCRGQSTDSLEQPERDALFLEAIRTIEYDNMLLSNETITGFSWYMQMHFPFPAYIFLMSELRARKSGDLAERAWEIMLENHERRGLMRNLRSPMHITFGNMFVKAWDAREAAELAVGNQLQTPKLINMLRQHFARINPKRGGGGAAGAGGGGGPQQVPMGGAGGGGSQQQGYGQQPVPGSASVSSASPSVGMASSSAGYGTSGKAMSDAPMSDMSGAGAGGGGGGMSLDGGNMMFGGGGFDGVNPFMAGPMGGTDGDFGQMDWSHYMLQFNSFGGGYGGIPGAGWPVPPSHPGAGQ